MVIWALAWRSCLFFVYLCSCVCCALETGSKVSGQSWSVPTDRVIRGTRYNATSDKENKLMQTSVRAYEVSLDIGAAGNFETSLSNRSSVAEARTAVMLEELASEPDRRQPAVSQGTKMVRLTQSSLSETALTHNDSERARSSSQGQEAVVLGFLVSAAAVSLVIALHLMSDDTRRGSTHSMTSSMSDGLNNAAEVIQADFISAARSVKKEVAVDLNAAAEVIEHVIDDAEALMSSAHCVVTDSMMMRSRSSASDYYSSESDEDWNNQEELSINLEIALFTPQVNNHKTFHEAREFIRQKGGALVLRRELESLGFLEPEGEQLATGEEPFNTFARMAAGKTVQPGMEQEQTALGSFQDKFLICRNREEDDANWNSNESELLRRASMSQRHRILTTKDLHWQWFNPLVFGMVGRALGGDSVQDALEEIASMEAAALEYCKNIGGWSDNVKLFFNCYGHCNENSLYIHILDADVIGKAFKKNKRKTCPFEVVSQVLEDEAATIAGTQGELNLKVQTSRFDYDELSVKAKIASKLPRINDVATLQTAREILLEAGGPEQLLRELVDEGFVDNTGAEDVLRAGEIPFNFFVRLGAGLEKQASMEDEQAKLGKYQEKFVVCQNRPEADRNWDSSDSRLLIWASMSRRHVFLTKRADKGTESYHWQWFNPLVYGLVKENEGGLSKDAVLAELEELKAAAMLYVKSCEDWSEDVGLFLNCYPHSTVHALLLHIVDMSELGPNFKLQGYKNLPLDAVLEFLGTEGF